MNTSNALQHTDIEAHNMRSEILHFETRHESFLVIAMQKSRGNFLMRFFVNAFWRIEDVVVEGFCG